MNRKQFYLIAVIAAAILILYCLDVSASASERRLDPNTLYSVTHVVDGDTFKVRVGGKLATIRMLGINTPETVDPRRSPECFGLEASNEAKDLLNGRTVHLVSEPNRESRDKYDRYLAYVYRNDGLLVNGALIKGGYAREYTYGKPYSKQAEFQSLEEDAREHRRGLWSACN